MQFSTFKPFTMYFIFLQVARLSCTITALFSNGNYYY